MSNTDLDERTVRMPTIVSGVVFKEEDGGDDEYIHHHTSVCPKISDA